MTQFNISLRIVENQMINIELLISVCLTKSA
jgi:hypothetical protein